MLNVKIEGKELFNPSDSTFINVKSQTLQLEHSLLSLSKWESKWHKPFLTSGDKTDEEAIDYYRFMTITQNVDPYAYLCLSKDNYEAINKYIEDPMTATTFRDSSHSKQNKEVITAELIYYWMVTYNIPFECQKWHLNRLLTLIRVCSIKNDISKKKKMSKSEIWAQNRALNDARRKALHSSG